jgi:hypothetical protein
MTARTMTSPDYGNRNDGLIGGLWAYFAPVGIATQWYWPPGYRGKLASLVHGRGWRIT